jgi:hypothetical protein
VKNEKERRNDRLVLPSVAILLGCFLGFTAQVKAQTPSSFESLSPTGLRPCVRQPWHKCARIGDAAAWQVIVDSSPVRSQVRTP